MSAIIRFEDIEAWKTARELNNGVIPYQIKALFLTILD